MCLCFCSRRLSVQFRSPNLERNMAEAVSHLLCGPFYWFITGMFCRCLVFAPFRISALFSGGNTLGRGRAFLVQAKRPPGGPKLAAAAVNEQQMQRGMHALMAEVNECSFVVGTLVCRRRGAREARKVESAQHGASVRPTSFPAEWKLRYLLFYVLFSSKTDVCQLLSIQGSGWSLRGLFYVRC